MLFSSFEFLFIFFPIFLTVYLLCKPSFRYVVLLAFSLAFYGLSDLRFLLLPIVSALVHYALAALAERHKYGVALAVGFDVLLLAFFKYYDGVAAILGFESIGLLLPLGISFYSFSALSYVIDVSRGMPREKNFFRFLSYVVMFPKILSGPIARYEETGKQLVLPNMTYANASLGICRLIAGLCKKLVLAAPAQELWEYFCALSSEQRGALGSWLALVFFAFWLYYDFSGYTDMAIGIAKILGFSLPENFDYPYISVSPRDFWRRWHITLSAWFRDYVYIPLGGNRCSRAREMLNLLAVWVLTGLWHGSTLNFLIWGLYWFVLLGMSKLLPKSWSAWIPHTVKRALMIPVILVSWLIFAFGDMGEGLSFFLSLFSKTPWTELVLYELSRNTALLAILVLGATPLPKKWFHRHIFGHAAARTAVALGAFLLALSYLAGGTHQPFLYLNF